MARFYDVIRAVIDNYRLLNDLPTFGLFFGTLAVRDLRMCADALGGSILHYLDKSGLECDAILRLENGFKIGGEALIAEGRAKLRRLTEEIDTKAMKEPSFRMIIVAEGDYAYAATDGTLICPIGCLRP